MEDYFQQQSSSFFVAIKITAAMKFHAKFEVLLQNNFRSVAWNQTFSVVNWKAESDDILQVYSTEIILNTATIRGKFDGN